MEYLFNNFPTVARLFGEQLTLSAIVLAIALLIAVPIGLAATRIRWLRNPILGVLGVIYTIPSLSLLVLLIPLLGLGAAPAMVALVAYAQLVLVRNLVVGLTGIDPWIIEAAKGMGMSGWQRLWRVEFPLALPLFLAGMRLATISIIGIGTIAAYVGAGGLGTLLFEGVTTNHPSKILAGAVAVSILAISSNYLLWFLERRARRAVFGD
ncbi:MAG: ABC transporter permease [Chloroflexi bacterium]|nr:ABC transporter permease [Chloroflexota bacterium]